MAKAPLRYLLGAGIGLTVLIAVGALCFRTAPTPAEPKHDAVDTRLPNLPLEQPTGGYVGSAACQSCHTNQHRSWNDSYHRTMTQVASEESVLGDFNDVIVAGNDVAAFLFKKDGRFKVEMKLGNSLLTQIYTVVMTTGSHNRQAYWLADPYEKQLMLLPFMYLRDEQRWIPRLSGYISENSQVDSSERLAFEKEKGRWQAACIRCHTTHGQSFPADDAGRALSHPRVAEFGISCEACHGSGAAHVNAKRNHLDGIDAAAAMVNPAKLPHDRSSQVCGQCHGVLSPRNETAHRQWQRSGDTFRPGDDLLADPICFVMRGRHRPDGTVDPVESGSFWSDGMIRVTGREFNALIESPCYQHGNMSCLSCHDMHQKSDDPRAPKDWAAGQLKPGMDGNRACIQCHNRFEDTVAIAEHTHHAADSSGSQCYNCHMPRTTYGLLRASRSHMVNFPNVADNLQAGRPNACNLCHLDKTLAWTADNLAQWYNQPIPKLSADEQKIAASILWALRGDAGQRALIAWSFGWPDAHQASGTNWEAPFLGQFLDDPYNAVRFIAQRSLKRFPGYDDLDYDFLAPAMVRSATVENVRKIWQQSPKDPAHPFADQTLIDPSGKIRNTDFERLLRQRDESPLNLAE